MDANRRGEEGQGCPWAVADRESHYCFFKLMADDPRPMDTAKIARLLMIEDSEVKKILSNFKRNMNEDGEYIPSPATDPAKPDSQE